MKTSVRSTKYANVNTIIIFFIAVLALTAIQVIRNLNHPGILIGEEGYYIKRIADNFLNENNLMLYDRLSYSGRVLSLQQGTPIIIALVSTIFNISSQSTCTGLPILLGIITLVLFYLLTFKIAENRKTAQLSLFLLALSPPFLYTFSSCNNFMLSIPLILLSLLFVVYKKQKHAFITFLFLPFFGTLNTVIALSIFLIYSLLRKEQIRLMLTTILFDAVILLLLNIPTIKSYGFPELLDFSIRNIGINFAFQNLVAEFGSKFGISIFTTILSFSGMAVLWKNKYRYLYVHISFILLLILSIYLVWPILYLNFLLTMLASIGLLNLVSMKWESRLIRNFTIFILLTGLIFTFLLHIDKTANLMPNRDIIDSLQALNAESNPEDIVLSHYVNGYWIEAVSSRPAFMDSSFIYAPNVNSRFKDMQEIFYSRSIGTTSELLDKHKIRFIYITKDMKSGLVWQDEEQGLLFLLKYNTRFKKLFSNENAELWLVLPE